MFELFICSWPIEFFKVLLLYRGEIQQGPLKEIFRVYLKNMFIIHLGYLIDLFLFCQWLQTEPSLVVPHYQPKTFLWRPTPRACAWCLCCGQLWAGHRPPAGSPVEAAACRTGGMGQGQCLVLVQVTGRHRSMSALVSQCVNTKKYSMQTCSEVITEHPTPWGAKSIVCWIACGNSSFCWQQQMGVQAPSSRYR